MQSSIEWLTGIPDGLFHNYPLRPLTQNVIKCLKNDITLISMVTELDKRWPQGVEP